MALTTLHAIGAVMLAASTTTSPETAARRAEQAFARGVQFQQQGDLKAAGEAYETARSLAPTRVDVLSNLGLMYSEMGEQDRAVRCFRSALKVNPRQNAVRFNLGVAYMRAKQYEQ